MEDNFSSSYLVAFIMGLFSSLHCIGMCGSIIGTLTLSLKEEIRNSKSLLFPFVLNYNLGRIVSYTIGGLIAGLLHYVLTFPFSAEHGHRMLQLLSAVFIACAGLYIPGWFPQFAYVEKLGARFWRKIEPYGRKIIPVQTKPQAFIFGLLWGWLPCGLVYAALALSATTGNVIKSALTMLSFGLGTLPAVMGLGIMTGLLVKLTRMQRFKQLVGILLVIIAIFSAFPWLNPMIIMFK